MTKQKHTPEFIKRQAKNLKKKTGISHTKALDAVCIELGFYNWKHYLNSLSSHIPAVVSSNLTISEPPQLSFTDWLKKHKNRDSPLGDLASDMISDSTWPLYESLEDYLGYMRSRNADRIVEQTLKRAWKSYKAYLRRLESPKPAIRTRTPKPKNNDPRKITYISNITPIHFTKRTVEKFEIGDKAWISWDGRKAIPVTVTEVDDVYYSFKLERPMKKAGREHYLRLDEVRSTPELACINFVTW